jgi:hypothetical protein
MPLLQSLASTRVSLLHFNTLLINGPNARPQRKREGQSKTAHAAIRKRGVPRRGIGAEASGASPPQVLFEHDSWSPEASAGPLDASIQGDKQSLSLLAIDTHLHFGARRDMLTCKMWLVELKGRSV